MSVISCILDGSLLRSSKSEILIKFGYATWIPEASSQATYIPYGAVAQQQAHDVSLD